MIADPLSIGNLICQKLDAQEGSIAWLFGYVPRSHGFSTGNQEVTYTAFHKADTIRNLKTNQHLLIDYGIDHQRMCSRLDHDLLQLISKSPYTLSR
jgi:hypothetical protein